MACAGMVVVLLLCVVLGVVVDAMVSCCLLAGLLLGLVTLVVVVTWFRCSLLGMWSSLCWLFAQGFCKLLLLFDGVAKWVWLPLCMLLSFGFCCCWKATLGAVPDTCVVCLLLLPFLWHFWLLLLLQLALVG